MLKYVLFDHDGTLFDTEPLALPTLIESFNMLYAKQLERNEKGFLDLETFVENFHGMARKNLCDKLTEYYGFAVQENVLFHGREASIASYFAKVAGGIRMAQHLIPTLWELKERGLQFAVVTNNPIGRAFAALRHAHNGLGGALLSLIGPNFFESNDIPKPNPDVYLRAMEVLGVKPEECVAIEDSVTGVKSAVAAGLRTLGYLGFAKDKKAQMALLEAAGCTAIFSDYAELPSLLEKLK